MKKTKPLPPCIEMLHGHYDIFIPNNTVLIYQKLIEPERYFENGEQADTYNDSFIEIRRVNDTSDYFYIYSTFTGRLWSTESLDEANTILKRELRYCNKFMKEVNANQRKESVEKFIKQTDPLLISAQNIIKGNSPNSN